MFAKVFLCGMLFVCIWSKGVSQYIGLSGTVRDTIGSRLEFVNIMAIPADSANKSIEFAITDSQGNYKLKLRKGTPYTLTISSLSFISLEKDISLERDSVCDFILRYQTYDLEGVEVTSEKIPIIVKQDSVIYNVDQFTDGSERKLRDILNALPGLEVDDQDNLLFKGARVTKLLVEGKPFFGGNTKLGVNHIPANVVDQIQVLEKYNEIPFLSSLTDNNDLSVNVKLKKERTKFAFGDIKLAGGVQDRYEINPSLFYYAPVLSVNSISNLNNSGKPPLTMTDFIQFEGGKNRLLNEGMDILGDVLKNFDFLLQEQHFRSKKTAFTGTNISADLNKKSRLDAYSIYQQSDTETGITDRLTYLIGSQPPIEQIFEKQSSVEDHFLINKLRYLNNISDKQAASWEVVLKRNVRDADMENHVRTVGFLQDLALSNNDQNSSLKLDSRLNWYKKSSKGNLTNIELIAHFNDTERRQSWLNDAPVLPFIQDSIFAINQDIQDRSRFFNFEGVHLVMLNNKNQISLKFNTGLNQNHLLTGTRILDRYAAEIQSENSRFDNDARYDIFLSSAVLQYKHGISEKNFALGMGLQHYGYQYQSLVSQHEESALAAMPFLQIKERINGIGKIDLSYKYRVNLPSIWNWLENDYVVSFNTLRQGTALPANSHSHHIGFIFNRYDIFTNSSYDVRVDYTSFTRGLAYGATIFGLDQLQRMVNLANPSSSVRSSFKVSKALKGWQLSPHFSHIFQRFRQLVDEQEAEVINHTIQYGFDLEKKEKGKVDLSIKIRRIERLFRNDLSWNRSTINRFSLDGSVRLSRSFLFKMQNRVEFFTGLKSVTTLLPILNMDLEYKMGAKWLLNLQVSNVFDFGYNLQNSQNQYIIHETTEAVLPRILLFSLSYTL